MKFYNTYRSPFFQDGVNFAACSEDTSEGFVYGNFINYYN